MHAPPVQQRISQGLLAWVWRCVLTAWLAGFGSAYAQGVELAQLQATRADGALNLDFVARVNLPRAVEDALQRGVPIYFVAEAQLLRNRWYWRDERVARVSRSWRLAYRPLTSDWRVSLGGLNQTFPSMAEALAAVSRSGGWKLADKVQFVAGHSLGEYSALAAAGALSVTDAAKLLRKPDVHLFNVAQADGYTRRIPYLTKLVMPRAEGQ